MSTPYDAENKAERERMRLLITQLDDDQLRGAANPDWTIAGVLAHLAFWDARVTYFAERWLDGRSSPSAEDREAEDVDWINDSSRPLAHALAPRAAAELALSLAEEADGLVAKLPAVVVDANIAAGDPVHLQRWQHRRMHLDEIEQALAL